MTLCFQVPSKVLSCENADLAVTGDFSFSLSSPQTGAGAIITIATASTESADIALSPRWFSMIVSRKKVGVMSLWDRVMSCLFRAASLT